MGRTTYLLNDATAAAAKSKRRKRRRGQPPPKDAPEVEEEVAPKTTSKDLTQYFVEEPKQPTDTTVNQKDNRERALDDLRRGVADIGGKRPADPNDAFDYGFGGIIKNTVFALSAALIVFDLYLNSPFFERKAPSPIVAAVTQELDKIAAPDPFEAAFGDD